jgi:hypothetical protein
MIMKTNFVIVVDYSEDNNYLDDNYILGWNNNYDYFDTETTGDSIIDTDGSIMDSEWGLIHIDRWTAVYVSETADYWKDHCTDANNDGINCTICRIELDNEGQWIVVPV